MGPGLGRCCSCCPLAPSGSGLGGAGAGRPAVAGVPEAPGRPAGHRGPEGSVQGRQRVACAKACGAAPSNVTAGPSKRESRGALRGEGVDCPGTEVAGGAPSVASTGSPSEGGWGRGRGWKFRDQSRTVEGHFELQCEGDLAWRQTETGRHCTVSPQAPRARRGRACVRPTSALRIVASQAPRPPPRPGG